MQLYYNTHAAVVRECDRSLQMLHSDRRLRPTMLFLGIDETWNEGVRGIGLVLEGRITQRESTAISSSSSIPVSIFKSVQE